MRKVALSLVELLVVLAILIVLTTVSIQATEGIIEQKRFDAARRQLEEIEAAVVGRPHIVDSDGRSIVSGYVADVGELPNSLQDLFDLPAGVKPFAYEPVPDEMNEVSKIGSGWRGPYLRLPIGQTAADYKDPYNQEFVVPEVGGLTSVSVNTQARREPFNEPLSVDLSKSLQASVLVYVEVLESGSYQLATSEQFLMKIFAPKPDTTPDSAQIIGIPESPEASTSPVTFNNNIPIGNRVVTVEETSGGSRTGLLNITVRPNGPNVFTIRAQ